MALSMRARKSSERELGQAQMGDLKKKGNKNRAPGDKVGRSIFSKILSIGTIEGRGQGFRSNRE